MTTDVKNEKQHRDLVEENWLKQAMENVNPNSALPVSDCFHDRLLETSTHGMKNLQVSGYHYAST